MTKRAPVKPSNLTAEQVGEIEAAVFQVIERHLPAEFYLVGVTLEKQAGNWYLQVFVECTPSESVTAPIQAISLQQCEQVSRLLDPVLETIPGVPAFNDLSYSLEVSSPGLFRPLTTAREFAFYKGQPVAVEVLDATPVKKKTPVFMKAIESKKILEGQLVGFDEATQEALLQPAGIESPARVKVDARTRIVLNPTIRLDDEDSPAQPI